MSLRRRKAIFDRGVAARRKTRQTNEELYMCPLCLELFARVETQAGGALSEEHAPPESLGGKVVDPFSPLP
jgi:hypothetical protein